MTIEKILIVDDELLVRNFLAETLRRKKFDVVTAENGQRALSLLKELSFDLVITDMKMPDLTGLEVLKKIKELSPQTMVVIITAFGSIENAVEAMRLGAFNYLIKPFSPDTIEAIIEKAQQHRSLLEENQYLRQQCSPQGGKQLDDGVIAESAIMKEVIAQALQVAKSQANIFIHGESGTGKEVIAHLIHTHSLRKDGPFIKVNCAAVPETLIESEFFGHEKGAFTGATARRLGRFELAHSGTLLLDEITETPLALQAKLLRVIQEQEFERVGGTKPVKVDVRLISTSNRDMKEAVANKIVREDLYYRLNVVPIMLPPLRERKEDIIPLAEYFLEKFSIENHRSRKSLDEEAKKKLLGYAWPGNVRELANTIERAVVIDDGAIVSSAQLWVEPADKKGVINGGEGQFVVPRDISLKELEKKFIQEVLEAHQYNRSKVAESLGISTRSLRTKLEQHSLS